MRSSTIELLSKDISCSDLVYIIGNEVDDPYNRECPQSVAFARLHGAAWEQDPPEQTNLPDYIKAGMSALKCVSTSAISEIQKIQEKIEELELRDSAQEDILFFESVIDWINVVSYRANHVDTLEVVLEIIKDWSERSGNDLEPIDD